MVPILKAEVNPYPGQRQSIYDQMILLGDSLFEYGTFNEVDFALVPALQQQYVRRLDVINRGFSGYNTNQALKVLPHLLPDPRGTNVRFLIILLGANDAYFGWPTIGPGTHVPLEQYRSNLVKILSHPAVKAHSPKVVLVTPTPIEERRMTIRAHNQFYNELCCTNVNTKKYVDAAREVAVEQSVACLDLFSIYMNEAGWQPGEPFPGSLDQPENEVIKSFLHDGLHLSPIAYRIFARELMTLIVKNWPDQAPDQLKPVLPEWDDSSWTEGGSTAACC